MKLFRNIMDERQKSETMRVERSTFWIVFFGLVVAIIVQVNFLGLSPAHIAGEIILLMVGTIWLLIGLIRRGIWDYFTMPGMKSYINYSLGVGVFVGAMVSLTQYFQYGAPLLKCLLVSAKYFAIVFVFSFVLTWLLGSVTKARQKKLQREYEDDNG